MTGKKEGLVCPNCKRRMRIELVPLSDSDQAHTGKMGCRECKREIKNGKRK